eukprot:14329203-Alexandrium_andersonii.AAC.1
MRLCMLRCGIAGQARPCTVVALESGASATFLADTAVCIIARSCARLQWVWSHCALLHAVGLHRVIAASASHAAARAWILRCRTACRLTCCSACLVAVAVTLGS